MRTSPKSISQCSSSLTKLPLYSDPSPLWGDLAALLTCLSQSQRTRVGLRR